MCFFNVLAVSAVRCCTQFPSKIFYTWKSQSMTISSTSWIDFWINFDEFSSQLGFQNRCKIYQPKPNKNQFENWYDFDRFSVAIGSILEAKLVPKSNQKNVKKTIQKAIQLVIGFGIELCSIFVASWVHNTLPTLPQTKKTNIFFVRFLLFRQCCVVVLLGSFFYILIVFWRKNY